MAELKKELDVLKEQMKKQECYVNYRNSLVLIQQNKELYEKLNQYRRKNVELHYHRQTLKDEANLEKQYHDFLDEDIIHEFLYWEQETLKMLRMIYKEIGETLTLDYSFLS
ncbi:MAG: hypothetical protein E7253_08445 [Lachnospiraceae bacterium]|nr:hypothetical protein [Lachnospiraceae bacterium]